jgi:hypothetical protein
MGDTGYQPYCEKCGAPVVWCACLDDIDWSLEMRSHLGRVRFEQQVKELRAEIDRLNAERRWIPANDAPINKRVYVLMPNNYVVIATKFKSLCKDPNHYLWRNDSGAICQVICWMPLPPAPESEG